MSTEAFGLHLVVKHLPAGSIAVLPDIGWDEYEELLEQIGENRSVRSAYCDGTLQITIVSSERECYACFIGNMLTAVTLRLRINILCFGSSTMRNEKRRKGLEPDACFYVQSADLIGNRLRLDFTVDPPPDIAVEIDIHHGSISKFPIYHALGIGEIWRYDGARLQVHLLEGDGYVDADRSRALPILTGGILTDSLTRLREEGEFKTILAFDEWLLTRQ